MPSQIRSMAATLLVLVCTSLLLDGPMRSGAAAAQATQPQLYLWAVPKRQLLTQGESVVFVVSLYNGSGNPLFVSCLKDESFVDFHLTGPDGVEVPWRGGRRITPQEHSSSDFIELGTYSELRTEKTISIKDGQGFVFDKIGQYSVTAEYSLEPSERFARFAGATRIPAGIFHSRKASFCIEACVHDHVTDRRGSEALLVHNNTSQAALDAVRVFYSRIVKYKPIGLLEGRAKRALWPLLSKRLAEELDGLQSCEDDYEKRYGEILRKNVLKSAIPWQEEGLFAGPNEAADPARFAILSSRAIGEKRVDVLLRFTFESCCGRHETFDYEGDATVILENDRWLVDDFVAMYENDDLERLSDGYRDCKDGKWASEQPY